MLGQWRKGCHCPGSVVGKSGNLALPPTGFWFGFDFGISRQLFGHGACQSAQTGLMSGRMTCFSGLPLENSNKSQARWGGLGRGRGRESESDEPEINPVGQAL